VRILFKNRYRGKTITGQDDILKVGVHLVNSEVGKYSIRIAPMVYRLVCTNGLMMWVNDGDIFAQRHIYLTEDEMFGRVSKAVGNALKVGADTVQLLRESRNMRIESPLDIIDALAKQGDFSQSFTDGVKNSFMEEPETSAYGIINAFTRSARNMSADERIEVEVFAGTILRNGLKIA
jgi:hypothetical protein